MFDRQIYHCHIPPTPTMETIRMAVDAAGGELGHTEEIRRSLYIEATRTFSQRVFRFAPVWNKGERSTQNPVDYIYLGEGNA